MKNGKKIVSLALGTLMISSTIASAVTLTDIGAHWAKEPVEKLVEEKVINGYEDKTFRPDNPVSRGEASKMISTYFGKLIKSKNVKKTFSDVDSSVWSEQFIKTLVEAEIIQGYPGDIFKPDNSIKRSEAAKMIYEALQNTGKYQDNGKSVSLKDIDGHWAKEAINKLVAMGAIKGYDNEIFKPENNITRAELAKILHSLSVPYAERTSADSKIAVVNAPKAYGIQLDDVQSTTENIKKWILESISAEDKDGNTVTDPEIELNQEDLEKINKKSEGKYPIKYSYQDKDGNTVDGTIDIIVSDFDFESIAGDKVRIKKYNGTLVTPAIPKYITGMIVTEIGDKAFYELSSLKGITIPNSVTSIGESAFYKCSSIESITIPGSVTSIGNSAFDGCSSLNSVEIPDSVTSIGEYAFFGCSSIENIEIPDLVTSIGSGTFYKCSGLKSLTIGNSVKSIGLRAFEGCSSLNSLEIPDSVTSIEKGAFEGCSSLKSLTIGSSVQSIGLYAFNECSSLKDITISALVTSIGEGAFTKCGFSGTIKVPRSIKTVIKEYSEVSITNDAAGLSDIKDNCFDSSVTLEWLD